MQPGLIMVSLTIDLRVFDTWPRLWGGIAILTVARIMVSSRLDPWRWVVWGDKIAKCVPERCLGEFILARH